MSRASLELHAASAVRNQMKHLTAVLLCAFSTTLWGFGFEDVANRAQQLAQKPYEKPAVNMPEALKNLSYDQYRDIRYKPDRAVWRKDKLPFELQLFHPGFYFSQPVTLHLIEGQAIRRLPFRAQDFDYGKSKVEAADLDKIPGFAGFRVHFPLNNPKYKDELLVFQGASYFRALGKHQHYGLSARGLAVDTGLMSGEEFPAFTSFWIRKPTAADKRLLIYGLLDSNRVTGAYRFEIRPGVSTVMEVRARVYLREGVEKVGLAPLTSMFHFGENSANRPNDYRPEVHDSDGLSIQTDSEWIWRPLINPRRLLVTSFSAHNPRGFGLMQRDRNFARYEDLEARYDLRPSAWVTPKGDWGAGQLELVQIPTSDETNDNIVAYWVPAQKPAPGRALDFSYSLAWQMENETHPPLARVVQTRRGHGYIREDDGSIRFNVDFEGGTLDKLPADAKLMAHISINGNGELMERQLYRNSVTGGWRTSLRVKRVDDEQPMEIRCILRNGQQAASETWAYILPPLKSDVATE